MTFWVRCGAAMMFGAVAAGAFGAHGLRSRLTPEMLAVWETGARYMAYHGLGLFVVAWLADTHPGAAVNAAGWCFLAGIVIFSGSLFALALTGIRVLGALTPIGGLAFLLGWAALAFGRLG
jgi:uncharacterized membrane protein YgdD (TMEM256/DUF423 family)